MAAAAIAAESAVMRIVVLVAGGAVRSVCQHRGQVLLMAAGAAELCVCTGQREIGYRAVIEHPRLPGHRAVTVRADLTERSGVIVILRMTIDAVLACIVKCGSRMTGSAVGLRVRANERKAAQTVIEHDIGIPGHLAVAASAVAAQLSLVRIGLMTSRALDRQPRGNGRSVAIAALRCGMCTDKRKSRRAEVIEPCLAPLSRRVTGGTVFAEAAAMDVSLGMAANAGLGQRSREVDGVARLALQILVLPFQGKPRNHPVTEIRLRPRCFVVTTCALGAITTVVHIFVPMTRSTAQGRSDKRLVTMTVDACNLLMSSAQREHRLRMIERNEFPALCGVAV